MNLTNKELIKLDLSTICREFIKSTIIRETIDVRVFETLKGSDLNNYLQCVRGQLAHNIAEHLLENDFITQNDFRDETTQETIIDSTLYIIKGKDIKKLLDELTKYIIERWLSNAIKVTSS